MVAREEARERVEAKKERVRVARQVLEQEEQELSSSQWSSWQSCLPGVEMRGLRRFSFSEGEHRIFYFSFTFFGQSSKKREGKY